LEIVELINYSLITALSVATSTDPHIRNPLFTRSLTIVKRPAYFSHLRCAFGY